MFIISQSVWSWPAVRPSLMFASKGVPYQLEVTTVQQASCLTHKHQIRPSETLVIFTNMPNLKCYITFGALGLYYKTLRIHNLWPKARSRSKPQPFLLSDTNTLVWTNTLAYNVTIKLRVYCVLQYRPLGAVGFYNMIIRLSCDQRWVEEKSFFSCF